MSVDRLDDWVGWSGEVEAAQREDQIGREVNEDVKDNRAFWEPIQSSGLESVGERRPRRLVSVQTLHRGYNGTAYQTMVIRKKAETLAR